ncbi:MULTISPECIES: hypothetical protein [unclassified Enterococcus]|uniref:hypothetical protein n=1 Tax=unclassified Enterococcus TaxID=2608891 RepID=UPI00155309D0|nr:MULTISPECIES: hypothetical protein [unclassified Enterococcus]MBS7578362.1 hypothetical protein [Enterococcus sp. MMGLQ5-2]MBS7585546.1 hypothetical protein [Enterococcus sp. MMGLQ5-1]NPD13405.1 hypothetical protein [Enterococcus sp. MMGLQ5-1]NPD38194.1 hypothetical protein [Enterococcus sp. MMGLQ5-2]
MKNLQGNHETDWLSGSWQAKAAEDGQPFQIEILNNNQINFQTDGTSVKLTRLNQNSETAFVYQDSAGGKYKFIKLAKKQLKFVFTAKKGLLGTTNAIVYQKVE